MKKSIFLIGIISVVLTSCLSVKKAETEEKPTSETEELISLEGEWKVTEHIAGQVRLSAHSHEEHYLGRSITIGAETIIRSLDFWPNGLDYKLYRYCMTEFETISSKDSRFYGENNLDEGWDKALGEQDLTLVTYSMGKDDYISNKQSFLITQDGQVICEYYGRYYFMERYKEADTDLSIEELLGNWCVKRLVSYQNGWKGNNSVGRAWERIYHRPISEEEGANFYPEEFLNNIVKIEAEGIKLYRENQLLESCTLEGYTSLLLDKHDYQKEKGVNDGLGISNREIQIFVGEGQAGDGKLLDGEIVVINDSEAIMKLYQGWYLLEKK